MGWEKEIKDRLARYGFAEIRAHDGRITATHPKFPQMLLMVRFPGDREFLDILVQDFFAAGLTRALAARQEVKDLM